jgi:hypothetical protein
MKRITTCLLSAVVMLLIGSVCWSLGRLEQSLAQAQQAVATLEYDGVQAAFEHAEHYFEYGSHIPGVGNQALNDIRARKASLQYWQRHYAAIVPQGDDPVASLPRDNTELQFIAANAVYRAAKTQVKDRQTALQAIDAGIKAYLVVLRNSTGHEDAAFNYEYLVRQRGTILAGPDKPKGGDSGDEANPHGQPGGAPQQTEMNDFKIQIPIDAKEFEDQKNGQEAGKTVARRRKG